MANAETIRRIRKLNQLYAFTSIQMHEAIGRREGFSGSDHKYLGFFIEKGPMTAGDLAKLTGLTTGAVTGLVDRFEKKRLVKRQFSAEDRRKVILVPDVEKIMALFVPLYKDYREKMEKLIASFSKKDLQVIESYFLSAVEIMNETTNNLDSKG